ncbi:MAG: pca operon transcription factor PcaQ [Proteobacteria bacterium]|nr:pca operon transcription factor PcaQ [Pseudomonadota bacterium]
MPRAAAPSDERAADAALSRIRLRHLQCFLAVAKLGNLRRAAAALSITQPAVTKTLNELEALLGKPLFVRSRLGSTLTAEAQAFLQHASDSVGSLGLAVHSVRGRPDATPLAIGVLPTATPSFLPGVLRAFAAQWPAVPVRVHTGRNAQLVEALRKREFDAVIGRLSDPELMAGLSFEHLYAEPVVAVVRAGHALVGKTRRTPDLAAWPLVLPPAGTLIRQVVDGFLQQRGLATPAGVVETLDIALARALVLQGDNLWFTPLGAAQPDLAAGTLRRLAFTLTPDEPVGLILRTEPAAASASLRTFVAAVRSAAATGRAKPSVRKPIR